jgi:protein-S-isoprenylcysteine O-methyltransferase Ste14
MGLKLARGAAFRHNGKVTGIRAPMINAAILLLCLINFGFIALLPRKFFKQNAQLSLHFWLTAAPLFVSPIFLLLAYLRIMVPFTRDSFWGHCLPLVGVGVSTLSILLLGMAIGAHRRPLHMFYDKKDNATTHLVTDGPYRWIRHPIYSSYLLCLMAAAFACPQIGTIASFLYGLLMLNHTACKEEARMCQSADLGAEYSQYIKRTGRFIPPLKALSLNCEQAQQQNLEKPIANPSARVQAQSAHRR